MFARLASIIVVLIVTASDSHAQGASVGYAKNLTTSFSYQYVPSSSVVLDPDTDEVKAPTRNHVFTLWGEYVPIDKLAVEVFLPFQLAKYTGSMPHTTVPGKWDDGSFHSSLTDLRIGARYQLLDEPIVAFSPHLAVSIPVMDYEVNGFATGGRHLKTVHVGGSVARSFDPYVPNLYFNAQYEFSLSEKFDATPETEAIKQKRSDIAFELGYFFLDGDLSVNLGMNWRLQHGGLNFKDFATYSAPLQNFHDGLLNEDFLFLGGGVAYSINEKFSVALLVRQFIRGFNTRNQDLYGLTFTWAVLR